MRFVNRDDAARRLAQRLDGYRGTRPLVLGVPRGGVPMARVVADALDGEVDVVLVRKIGAPGQPEFAIGAVDETGHVVRGEAFADAPEPYVRDAIRRQLELLRARRERYTRAHPTLDAAGRVVILVDDGVATGASMTAAVHAVRARRPARLVVAVAVASREALARLQADADEVVCLAAPDWFTAVGEFFDDFTQVSDEAVVAALDRSAGTTAGA